MTTKHPVREGPASQWLAQELSCWNANSQRDTSRLGGLREATVGFSFSRLTAFLRPSAEMIRVTNSEHSYRVGIR